MGNAAQFAAQIDREFDEALDELREVVMQVAKAALRKLVERTPVRSGLARGSWRVAVGNQFAVVQTTTDKDGIVTISQGEAVIASYALVNGLPDITIYTDLSYMPDLEAGRGRTAPGGILAITVAELTLGAL